MGILISRWCVRETMLSLINYKLRTHIWESRTARSVNNDTGETLYGFVPQANDSPGCNIPQLTHTHTPYEDLADKHLSLNKESKLALCLPPSLSIPSSLMKVSIKNSVIRCLSIQMRDSGGCFASSSLSVRFQFAPVVL